MKVMQCWDDGIVNDEPLVGLLRKYGAKATFNITPGINLQSERKEGARFFKDRFRVDRLSLDEMKDLYKGFKVAGHTMTHPHLENMDDYDAVMRELVECRDYIIEAFGQEKMGFAYPFGTYNDQVKKAVKEAGYLYARTTQNIAGALPMDDPMALHSHCHFLNDDFWQKYEAVREADGVFYFWGHSYEMMDDAELWDGFEEKLARIQSDEKAEWIDIVDLFV